MRAIFQVLICGILAACPAQADDSMASLGAGGLQLLTSEEVALDRQNLVLSPDLVTVHFTFRNLSTTSVESLVAFVFPDLTAEDYRHRFLGLPNPEGANFLAFEGQVDGRRIDTQWDIRAIADDGSDITDRLVTAGGSPDFFSLDSIPGIRDRLAAIGALDEDGIPLWTMRSRLYWRQSFPPSQPVRVEHRYRPMAGGMALFPHMLDDGPGMPGLAREYCLAARDRAKAESMIDALAKGDRIGSARFVDYSLTTGANWAGPIKHLSVTINAGGRDRLAATCFAGLTKIAPGQYQMTASGVEPDQDIHLMIIGPQ